MGAATWLLAANKFFVGRGLSINVTLTYVHMYIYAHIRVIMFKNVFTLVYSYAYVHTCWVPKVCQVTAFWARVQCVGLFSDTYFGGPGVYTYM